MNDFTMDDAMDTATIGAARVMPGAAAAMRALTSRAARRGVGRPAIALLALSAAALLSACGADSGIGAEATSTPAAVPVPAQRSAGLDDASARMARAVGNGKPGAAVDIRYEMLGKPTVGVPTELEIVFVPSAGVDALNAKIGGMDGVTLAGELMAVFGEVEAGKPYKHTVSLLPDRSGVFYVTVTATTQIRDQSLARTFSIPFVVGAVSAQQKVAPPVDAAGEPIESMKAQESAG